MLTVGRPGSSSSRYGPRRGSTASSIHSIGGALDTSSQWHELNESGQNGIEFMTLVTWRQRHTDSS
jgi:hypothetical protein